MKHYPFSALHYEIGKHSIAITKYYKAKSVSIVVTMAKFTINCLLHLFLPASANPLSNNSSPVSGLHILTGFNCIAGDNVEDINQVV